VRFAESPTMAAGGLDPSWPATLRSVCAPATLVTLWTSHVQESETQKRSGP
jgi:hypothetical protein